MWLMRAWLDSKTGKQTDRLVDGKTEKMYFVELKGTAENDHLGQINLKEKSKIVFLSGLKTNKKKINYLFKNVFLLYFILNYYLLS